MNTIAIARHRPEVTLVTTFALNWLWWHNARTANGKGSGVVYASGAACGAALVVWLS